MNAQELSKKINEHFDNRGEGGYTLEEDGIYCEYSVTERETGGSGWVSHDTPPDLGELVYTIEVEVLQLFSHAQEDFVDMPELMAEVNRVVN